jgi:hypothetical protein
VVGAGLTALSHLGFAFVADGFWWGLILRAAAGIGWAGAYMPGLKAIADTLEGNAQSLRGHVGGVARGINVPNAQPDQAGLASVNPIFTWVRLAQRVPVRIHIDQVPDGVHLVAGITATVQIDPRPKP